MQTSQTSQRQIAPTRQLLRLSCRKNLSLQPSTLNSHLRWISLQFSLRMRFIALAIGLLATMVSSVTATALTYKLEANEKACFFTYVDQPNTKVAFYFAVRFFFFLTSLYCNVCRAMIDNHVVDSCLLSRFNPAVLSMSITPLSDRAIMLLRKEARSARAISYSRLRVSGSTGSVSIMKCRRLQRRWSISRSQYVHMIYVPPLHEIRTKWNPISLQSSFVNKLTS